MYFHSDLGEFFYEDIIELWLKKHKTLKYATDSRIFNTIANIKT